MASFLSSHPSPNLCHVPLITQDSSLDREIVSVKALSSFTKPQALGFSLPHTLLQHLRCVTLTLIFVNCIKPWSAVRSATSLQCHLLNVWCSFLTKTISQINISNVEEKKLSGKQIETIIFFWGEKQPNCILGELSQEKEKLEDSKHSNTSRRS